MTRYRSEEFEFVTPPELSGATCQHGIVVIGAGPVGLTLAIDLAMKGVRVTVVDDNNVVSVGSRAICWAKRTLEIFDRIGIGEKVLNKGVTWKVGRLYHGAEEVYQFDLLPEPGHRMPAFVNLQQYYVEEYLVDRARELSDLIELRFKNKVVDIEQSAGNVALTVETPAGAYKMDADWVIACDGANSPVRQMMGLDFAGQLFEERFLIADVEMTADFPSERRFWFNPPFHSGQSALLHKQPDNIYRIDLQLGWDSDPEEERKPENVIPRIRAMVGDRPFELDWVSVYTFQCRRMERFIHDRIIFCGDSAHVVSPFGARGGNGGIQDADNLAWKLAAVCGGAAAGDLLESYNIERVQAADENIGHSSRATNFMTPKSNAEHSYRDAVLGLAVKHPFARRLINSGRLSVPCVLQNSPLDTPASDMPISVGSAAIDAPISVDGKDGWLLSLLGNTFTLLRINSEDFEAPEGVRVIDITDAKESGPVDKDGLVAARYGSGYCYLVRPDQQISAVFKVSDQPSIVAAVQCAFERAKGFRNGELAA